MNLSTRISGLTGGGDDGWALFYRARAMKAAGVPVTELTIGEHDIPTDPAILQAMEAAARGGHTGYSALFGTDALRDTIAARVTRRTGVPTTRDNVLVTPGGQGALFAAFHATCDEGDGALFIDPYYATYPGTIRAVGARPIPVAATPQNGFQPQRPDLEAALAEHGPARCLLINSPNNPTGVIYSPETLAAIAGVCRDNDLWLISDEVYDTQVWDGTHLSPRALPEMEPRTLVIGSMSKSHAMTGSRIGWIVGPATAIATLSTLSLHTTYGLPGYIQDAALFALQAGPELEQRIAAPFARRRALAMDLLARQNAVRLVPSGGAMYLMLDIRATGLGGEAFALALLEEEHIAVMPGDSFGAAAAGHIRVAMTVDDDAFADALTRLIAFTERTLP